MVTALGVDRNEDTGLGMDAVTHRRILAAHWENLGVVAGLEVSGAPGLRYQASAGVAVCSTGGADGVVEAYWPGGLTAEAVAAGDSAYGRIDMVYLLAPTTAGGQVSLHVAQGVPSASPSPPAPPAGALAVGGMLVPAGASTTQSAAPWGSVDYAVPYGAGLGRIAHEWSRSSYQGGGKETGGKPYYEQQAAFHLATDRQLEFRFDNNFSASDQVLAEQGVAFHLDSDDLEGSSTIFVSQGGSWTTHSHSFVQNVARGDHTASVMKWWAAGSAPVYHYGANRTGLPAYVGQRFQIFDRGVAR